MADGGSKRRSSWKRWVFGSVHGDFIGRGLNLVALFIGTDLNEVFFRSMESGDVARSASRYS